MVARYPDLRLSVIFPAYNEEGNIERTIRRAIESLRRMVGAFEILLIDDCSKDKTPELAAALARAFPEIVYLRNETNLRQGGVLRKGFALAKYEYVTHNAMDYPFDFENLPLLLDHVPMADVVVAARKRYPGTTAQRRFVSWVNRTLLDVLFGAHLRDYNFIQVYKKSVLLAQPTLSDATSFVTPEIIIRAHKKGLSVVEVDVDYHRREVGQPSSANTANIRRAIADMGRLWLELHRESVRSTQPVRDKE